MWKCCAVVELKRQRREIREMAGDVHLKYYGQKSFLPPIQIPFIYTLLPPSQVPFISLNARTFYTDLMIDHLLLVEALSLDGIRMEENPRIAIISAQHQADNGLGITAIVSVIISGVVILSGPSLNVGWRETM